MSKVANKLVLEDLLRFSRFMLQFQNVERAIHLPGRVARENDAEHSYQLAMAAWYLNTSAGLGYDTDKIIRYALVHDIPETYAGDPHAYDPQARRGKAERERRALRLIAHEYPEAAALVDTVHEYDLLDNPESRFVYALDKLLPNIHVFLEGGTSWRDCGLTPELLHAGKRHKVALSEPVKELYDQLKALIDVNPQLFDPPPAVFTISAL